MTKVSSPGSSTVLRCNLEQAPLPLPLSVSPSVQERRIPAHFERSLRVRKICQQPARVLRFLFGCGLRACAEILIIRDFEARAYSQPPPHTRHQMRAQTEAPTSEAAHCSGPTPWPPPRRKTAGAGILPALNICPYSPFSSPEPNPILTAPPHSHILSLLPYRFCKMSKNSGVPFCLFE